MLSKHYESTEVERRIWLHVPSGGTLVHQQWHSPSGWSDVCMPDIWRFNLLCPVPTVANVENNELRIENNAISGHILLALFSSRRALLSILRALVVHYSAFSSVLLTDANVLNCSKHSSPILNSPHSPVKFSSERSSFVLHSSLFAARYSHVIVNLRH